MKWFDNCLFNGEIVMKLRLEYLSPHVDTFFICEQRYTHQGSLKEKLFIEIYKDWFEPYSHKIVFLVDETKPTPGDTWNHENNHRNFSMTSLSSEKEPFICSVCDLDEIPDVNVVLQQKELIYAKCKQGPVYMDQLLVYYNLNWYVEKWSCAFFISNEYIHSTSNSLQSIRNKQVANIGSIIDCGWHLSYCMSASEIQRKLLSFAHKEYNTNGSKYTDINYIQDCISKGIDLYNRYPNSFKKISIDIFPPEFKKFHNELLKLQQ